MTQTLYTTPQDVRDLLGLTIEDAPDVLLEEFIEKAQNVLLHYIQVKVLDECPTLDVSGTTLTLSHRFLADTNFDKQITSADIKVYGWEDADDISSRTSLQISTIYPEHGIVVLSSSASSYEKVTVDYAYYTCSIDWNLVALATAYYAGMLWVAREEFLVPDQLTIGNVKVRQKEPWENLRNEFLRIVFHLTALPMDVSAYRKIVKPARSTLTYVGPGTVLEEEDESIGTNLRDPEAN